jgi:lipid-binding SYLF domain-containing protein
MNRWKTALVGVLVLAPFSFAGPKADDVKEADRLQNAGTVMKEILNVPDDIPQDLLDKARCVVVLPSVLKAAFIAGGSYGRGVMVCRTGKDFTGPWGAPAMYALEGGSFGLQIGGEATDFVILVMNTAVSIVCCTAVKLGADASVAAGPKGRTASADTDAYMCPEMLSYSRSRASQPAFRWKEALVPTKTPITVVAQRDASAAKIIPNPRADTPPAGRPWYRACKKPAPT